MQHQPKIPPQPELRLLIVADVRLYRDGIHGSLSTRPRFHVVGSASNADEALRLTTDTSPDIVIVDMATKGSLALIRQIRERAPEVPIIGFGVDEVEGEVLACAEAGLSGYVPCDASLDELVTRIESVHKGELVCTPRIAAALFRSLQVRDAHAPPRPHAMVLTARERAVLRLIDAGLSNKEIATQLNIELSTVKNHVHNVLDKLNVTTRMQAAACLGEHVSRRQREVARARPGA